MKSAAFAFAPDSMERKLSAYSILEAGIHLQRTVFTVLLPEILHKKGRARDEKTGAVYHGRFNGADP